MGALLLASAVIIPPSAILEADRFLQGGEEVGHLELPVGVGGGATRRRPRPDRFGLR